MKFQVISETFQTIEQTSSRLEMTKLLSELFKQASATQAEIISYFSLGELYPPYKNLQYNIADKLMIPVVARLLTITEQQVKERMRTAGDLGAVIEQGSWLQGSSDLSVSDVYEKLIDLEKIEGTGSQEQKAGALFTLLGDLDSLSAKYVVRIVLGKLRLGFSDMTVIDALSWMEVGDKSIRKLLEHAYNISVDIGLIAKTLKEGGIEAIEKMHISIGIPIRPAAAERLPTAKDIIEKIGDCVAQPKLDGFRLQIHLDKTGAKPVVHFFSRNMKDMSDMFPDLVTPIEALDVDTLICEGEAIGYDPNTDTFLPFQETVKRKRKHGITEAATEFPLKLFLFDLLYLNGESLLDEPHEQRYTKLKQLVKEDPNNPLQFIQEKEITTAKQLEEYFYSMIGEGLEGVVVKRMDAIYQPGKRNFNWIKLKRQEEGSLDDTIDCVILGYYYGTGKRASFGIGAFLIGLFDAQNDRFETVAKVGTGLSDIGWKELREKLDAIAVPQKPRNVECAKELYPDVWALPEIMCIVRADEITKSPTHTAGKTAQDLGFALRFPRFMGYRDDKSPEDATTVAELRDMFAQQKMR
jgi:DNA ligase 1